MRTFQAKSSPTIATHFFSNSKALFFPNTNSNVKFRNRNLNFQSTWGEITFLVWVCLKHMIVTFRTQFYEKNAIIFLGVKHFFAQTLKTTIQGNFGRVVTSMNLSTSEKIGERIVWQKHNIEVLGKASSSFFFQTLKKLSR